MVSNEGRRIGRSIRPQGRTPRVATLVALGGGLFLGRSAPTRQAALTTAHSLTYSVRERLWHSAACTFGLPLCISREAPRRAAVAQLQSFRLALILYAQDHGTFPTTAQGLRALVKRPTQPPIPRRWRGGRYLDHVQTVPNDPWGRAYLYQSPAPGGADFALLSYGADGVPGGSGDNTDQLVTGFRGEP